MIKQTFVRQSVQAKVDYNFTLSPFVTEGTFTLRGGYFVVGELMS